MNVLLIKSSCAVGLILANSSSVDLGIAVFRLGCPCTSSIALTNSGWKVRLSNKIPKFFAVGRILPFKMSDIFFIKLKFSGHWFLDYSEDYTRQNSSSATSRILLHFLLQAAYLQIFYEAFNFQGTYLFKSRASPETCLSRIPEL
uniref:Uncharacterized protein n=1 Tax=Salix viminalis TaxID=40686 RepID=A0A6N2K7H0_SALVM